MSEDTGNKLDILLDHLKRSRGFDFHGYKRSTLIRRIMKRLQLVGISDYMDYLDYLEVHPDEFIQLFNTILINVTSFFRDQSAWDILAKEILPQVLAGKLEDKPIRLWSAGCASGEEVYSLAMLLVEAIGSDAFIQRVKIYATDADEEALNQARQGIYSEKDLKPVAMEMREKYFRRNGDEFTFRADLRRSIIFGRHDLVQDAPISRLDLLACRNTLMYFNSETQNRILARFHFALNDSGFLFLGKAEMLLSHPDLFTPVAMAAHIFSKIPQPNLRDRLLALVPTGSPQAANSLADYERLHILAFQTGTVAQIILDSNGMLALANARARSNFNLTEVDFGRPVKDLELYFRPVELHSVIARVNNDLHPIKLTNIEVSRKGNDPQFLDIEVSPLTENGDFMLGLSILYEDVTARKKIEADLGHSKRELEAIGEVIESTHEELETTNEELQSTNEELETTNEELQATNEELETMNEELQATNEELETMNDELGERTKDVNQTNAFLQSILTSLQSGVIVVDQQFNVLLWNHRAEDMWGLRLDEVKGKSLYTLDIGLPMENLPLRTFVNGDKEIQEVSLAATNRRGKPIQCHVVLTPFWNVTGERAGVVFLIEEL